MKSAQNRSEHIKKYLKRTQTHSGAFRRIQVLQTLKKDRIY
jgi:hypothetical protein